MTDIPADLPLVIVAGPTASGKSALGLAIAEHFGGDVINADSMQVYRDLRILSARPTPEEEARLPHRLYGVLDGADHGTAARWRGLARQAIAETAVKGRLPVLVGGTGMYLRGLLEGMVEVPPIPEAARRQAQAMLSAEGAAALHARLDAETAVQLQPHDSQRVLRATEVLLGTGKGLAAWRLAGNAPGLANPVAWILLRPPRAALYARIDRRFEAMMAAGALDEARAVAARQDLPADAPMRKAHGLPELLEHLAGRISLAEAIRIGQLNTRHYAKRQTTWFRHQLVPRAADCLLVEETDLGEKENFKPEAKIFPFIVRYLLTMRWPAV
ncbi:tRNA (adenosine(37)-N6)-dimethylallyltransferase MiaA [Ferrovibrio sp.]|uniref:tRNA (adenosine(37)-N6)-dimethylallyltransferase MiaA n=1 Tax=Ferrovibrio sp. TaxID=1917215 RepID=UPI0035B3559C